MYYIKYQLKNGKWRMLNSETKKFTTMDNYYNIKEPKFDLLAQKDGEKTDEFALKYLERFDAWCEEIKDVPYRGFDYRKSFLDSTNVSRFFNYYCLKHYKHHEQISPKECIWMNKCNNGGTMYLNPDYEDTTVKSYGYDFRGYYGLLLNSDKLMIPSKQGTELTLDTLPTKKKLKYGYYHVRITCEDDDFRKIFAFSRNDVYLDISLKQAMTYQKAYNVSIELVDDGEPNAYIYDEDDMVSLKTITNEWYKVINKMKTSFPKNKLVKHLMSTAWGTLNQKNIVSKTLSEIDEMIANGKTVGMSDTNDYMILDEKTYLDSDGNEIKTLYVLLVNESPCKFNIRLKPYITALGRNMIGEIARENLDGVIRIHTDGIVFNCKMEFDDDDLIPEDKTTGKIHWKNVNGYEKV